MTLIEKSIILFLLLIVLVLGTLSICLPDRTGHSAEYKQPSQPLWDVEDDHRSGR